MNEQKRMEQEIKDILEDTKERSKKVIGVINERYFKNVNAITAQALTNFVFGVDSAQDLENQMHIAIGVAFMTGYSYGLEDGKENPDE